MSNNRFLTIDCSPPIIRVVPSWPHVQVGAVVVVVVVVVVVAGAAVVVVQQGLVGKVGVRSMPNLASWLLLHSRQVSGRAGGGTYSMPTVPTEEKRERNITSVVPSRDPSLQQSLLYR